MFDKRGNWVDIFYWSIGAVVLGVVFILVFIMLSSFNTGIQTVPIVNDSSTALSISSNVVSRLPNALDWIIPFVYVVFFGFSVWASSKIYGSHKLFFLTIIVMFLLVLFAMYIESVWFDFSTNAYIVSYIVSFPITDFVLTNLRYFVLLYGITVSGVLYAKIE